MKKFLTLFIGFLPLLALAQECDLKDVKDPLNQETRLSTGFKKMGGGNDRFMISGEVDKKELDFFFVLEGTNLCFDEFARVQAVFEGGKQKAIFRNGGAENCTGYFHIIFKNQVNQPANLKNLSQKKVISLIFSTRDKKEKKVDLGPEEQDTFQRIVTCILNTSPELLNDTWKPNKRNKK